MTTMGTMKTRIANEMMRPDLLASGAIESEIRSAVRHYRSRRFWFTEKRDNVAFHTAPGISDYAKSANQNIPNLIRIDYVTIHDGCQQAWRMAKMEPARMDVLLANTDCGESQPTAWSYYAQNLRLYPRPDDTYHVIIAGVIRICEPVNDDEAENPWMVEAEEMIRARAKRNLYANSMLDPTMAQTMAVLERESFDNLTRETSSRTQVRSIRPHCI